MVTLAPMHPSSFGLGFITCWCLIMAGVTFTGKAGMHRLIDWARLGGEWWHFALLAWLCVGVLWFWREQKK